MNPAEDYMLNKPEPWRSMLMELQAIIKHTVPEVDEQFKWKLPFYSLHGRMFCFLNFRKNFIDVGFPWGIHCTIHQGHLVAGENRKNIRSLRYYTPEDIDGTVLIEVLQNLANNNIKKRY